MATIVIPDLTYRRLQAVAAARGVPVDKYLEELAAQGALPQSDSAKQLAALEAFAAGMTAWTSTHLPPGHIVDDSRDSVYSRRAL